MMNCSEEPDFDLCMGVTGWVGSFLAKPLPTVESTTGQIQHGTRT